MVIATYVDVLVAPGEVDDACISAGIPGVPLDDAAVAVIVPSLGVFSKVDIAATIGGGEDERLSREDAIEDAVAGGDDQIKELDERNLDSVVAVGKEELGGAFQVVEWHFRCID